LHRNEHLRLDFLLARARWLGPASDGIGLAVSAVLLVYGVRTIANSAQQGAMVVKSLVFPEWWLYAPVPLCFLLLSIEFVRRLASR
jgi:TRAP-type C4-dicarboxylate transport system permease small subunit